MFDKSEFTGFFPSINRRQCNKLISQRVLGIATLSVDADERGIREGGGHALEGETDDGGGVETDTVFQQDQFLVPGFLQEVVIVIGAGVPALIFYKVSVFAYIDFHRSSTDGTDGNQF